MTARPAPPPPTALRGDPRCATCSGLGWFPNPEYDEWETRQGELMKEWIAAGRPGGRWLDSDSFKAHRDAFPSGDYQLDCPCTRPRPGQWLRAGARP